MKKKKKKMYFASRGTRDTHHLPAWEEEHLLLLTMRAALQPWRAGTLLFLLLCLPFPSFPRDVPSEPMP